MTHLDSIQFRPGWKVIAEEEFRTIHTPILSSARWIIDGVAFPRTLPERLAAADTVIFLDYSIFRIYWWALKKEAKYAFRQRPEMPPECPEWAITWRLLKLIWVIHKKLRPGWLEQICSLPAGVAVHHLRHPRDAERLLRSAAG